MDRLSKGKLLKVYHTCYHQPYCIHHVEILSEIFEHAYRTESGIVHFMSERASTRSRTLYHVEPNEVVPSGKRIER